MDSAIEPSVPEGYRTIFSLVAIVTIERAQARLFSEQPFNRRFLGEDGLPLSRRLTVRLVHCRLGQPARIDASLDAKQRAARRVIDLVTQRVG